MARLTNEEKEDIKNALLLGDSQYKVAQDFEVSSATVNKIFKTIPEEELNKVKGIVKDEVTIKSTLAEQSERFMKAFDDKVNDEVRRRNLVFDASEKLLQKTTKMIEDNKTVEKISMGDGVQNFEQRELNSADYKNLADTIDKTSITLGVNQRHANSQVQINNTNAQQTNNEIKVEWE